MVMRNKVTLIVIPAVRRAGIQTVNELDTRLKTSGMTDNVLYGFTTDGIIYKRINWPNI